MASPICEGADRVKGRWKIRGREEGEGRKLGNWDGRKKRKIAHALLQEGRKETRGREEGCLPPVHPLICALINFNIQ